MHEGDCSLPRRGDLYVATNMTLIEAKTIALDFINASYINPNDELVIIDAETIEREYGWYFFSCSKRFLETRNFSDLVLGNGPVLVEKKNGWAIQLGTSHNVEWYIDMYEKGLLGDV